MAGEWTTVRIGDIAEKIAMGPFGSSIKVETFVPEGVPVISGAHLRGTRLEDGEFNFVSFEHAGKLKNANVFRGDVIFTHAGNIGQAAYIPENSRYDRYVISQRQFYLRCDRSKAQPEFLAYYFKSRVGQHKLLANASQVGVPSIARPSSYLKTIEISLPSIGEQRAIAHILGTLDDKIELNRRINETLEAIARAMFKSWFVDFDPVRAKMSGEPPESICQRLGLTPDHLALFPDRLVDSDQGEIPEGWEIRKIEALLSRLSSKVRYTKDEVKPYGAVPVFEQGASILLGYHNGIAQFEASPEEPAFIFGDHTCVTHLACEPFDISQNVIPLKGSDRPTLWVYYAVRDKQAFQEYRRHWMELIAKDVVVAPQPICEEFAQLITPLHLGNESNVRQSRELAAIRDAILPKLFSGELRVPVTGEA